MKFFKNVNDTELKEKYSAQVKKYNLVGYVFPNTFELAAMAAASLDKSNVKEFMKAKRTLISCMTYDQAI